MRMRIRMLLAAPAVVIALAACGGNSVGSSGLFDYTPHPPGNFGFEHSPSPAAQAALGSQNDAPASAAPKQQAPPPVQQQAATFAISIYGDNAATPGFNPVGANVYTNTIITWTNKDSRPRSVVSDSGPASFSSPMIPPGGSWSFTVKIAGSYNYHDGTRPYALGSFKAIAH